MSCIIPPTILRQPESQELNAGSTLTLFVIAYSSSPITSYQWYKDGSGILGATSPTYSIPSVAFADRGAYVVDVSNTLGSVRSNVAVVSVIDTPIFVNYTTVPADLSGTNIPLGSTFSITANILGVSLQYQWQKDGSDILGATSATYSDVSATIGDSGLYRITYTNPSVPGYYIDASYGIMVSVTDAPRILAQPQPQIVADGSSATFSVDASGTGPLYYQWYDGSGIDISGATAPIYTTPPTTPANNGEMFYVDISNAYGTVRSNVVSLTVVSAPVINSQPTGGSIIGGGSFTMCVSASGYGNTYQWYKAETCDVSGVAIPGATGACYSISPSTGDDGGAYYVIVTNIAGTQTSICVVLYVEVIDCVRGLIGFAGGGKEGANMASGLTSQKERVVLRCHANAMLPTASSQNMLPRCLGGFVPNLYAGGTSSGALLQSKINEQIVCDTELNLALAKRRMSVQPCSQPVGDTRFLKYQRLGPPVPCAPPPTGFIIPYNPAVPTAINGPCVNVIGIRVTRP
jgi:hypothetical protein